MEKETVLIEIVDTGDNDLNEKLLEKLNVGAREILGESYKIINGVIKR